MSKLVWGVIRGKGDNKRVYYKGKYYIPDFKCLFINIQGTPVRKQNGLSRFDVGSKVLIKDYDEGILINNVELWKEAPQKK